MLRNSESDEPKTGVDRWQATETHAVRKTKRVRPRKVSKRPKLRGDARRYVGTLVAIFVLCVVCVIGFTPLSERITQGLDIQGGVSVILTASKSDGSSVSSSDMDTAKSIVEKRVNALGSSEATVQLQGTNSILVQIPGATNADETVSTIGQTGHLEFVKLEDIGDAEALAKISAGTDNVPLQEGTYTAFMDGSYVESSTVTSSTTSVGTYEVDITLNSEGTQIFSDVTTELAPTKARSPIVLGPGSSTPRPAVPDDDYRTARWPSQAASRSQGQRELKDGARLGFVPVTLTYFPRAASSAPTLGPRNSLPRVSPPSPSASPS